MDNEKLFELIEKMYGDMQHGFKSLNTEIDTVKTDIKKIDFKIDNYVMPKIEALFDGYKQNTENISELKDVMNKRFDEVQLDINSLTVKTANSDSKIIELSKNIRNIK